VTGFVLVSVEEARGMLADSVLGLVGAAGFVVVGAEGDPGGAGLRAFDGQVPDVAPPAFVVVRQTIPDVWSRSLARSRQAHRCLVRVTVTAGTAEGVRSVAQTVVDGLEGRRPVAAGWSVSPIELLNTRAPEEDRDADPGHGGRYPMFAVLEFEYTATLTA
jgi:hypothetical protein